MANLQEKFQQIANEMKQMEPGTVKIFNLIVPFEDDFAMSLTALANDGKGDLTYMFKPENTTGTRVRIIKSKLHDGYVKQKMHI